MKPLSHLQKLPVVVAAAWMLAACQVAGAADERNDRRSQDSGQARGNNEAAGQGRFGNQDRVVIRDYFAQEFRGGRCPPGLAKKNNGCQPPGQANQWQQGQRLSGGVNFYELPAGLLAQIGQPPRGSHYARVDDDILLLQLGTELVIDVIADLSR